MFIRRLRDLLLTTPSAPLRNGDFYLWAQPPLLENGGEWTRLATNPTPVHSASQSVGQFLDRINSQFPILIGWGLGIGQIFSLLFQHRVKSCITRPAHDQSCTVSQDCRVA